MLVIAAQTHLSGGSLKIPQYIYAKFKCLFPGLGFRNSGFHSFTQNLTLELGKVQQLKDEMNQSRQARLQKLGFSAEEAKNLSSLHTRNFM